jgi:hypothetical protein
VAAIAQVWDGRDLIQTDRSISPNPDVTIEICQESSLASLDRRRVRVACAHDRPKRVDSEAAKYSRSRDDDDELEAEPVPNAGSERSLPAAIVAHGGVTASYFYGELAPK